MIAEAFCHTPGKLNGRLRKIFSGLGKMNRRLRKIFIRNKVTELNISEDFSHTLGKLNGRLRKISVLLLAN